MKAANEQLQRLQPITSCEESELNGIRRLKSGDEVYCHQRWQVSWQTRRFSYENSALVYSGKLHNGYISKIL